MTGNISPHLPGRPAVPCVPHRPTIRSAVPQSSSMGQPRRRKHWCQKYRRGSPMRKGLNLTKTEVTGVTE